MNNLKIKYYIKKINKYLKKNPDPLLTNFNVYFDRLRAVVQTKKMVSSSRVQIVKALPPTPLPSLLQSSIC